MKRIQLILAVAALAGSSGLNAQTKPKTENKDEKTWKPSEACTTKEGATTCNIFRFREDSTLIKRAAIGVQIETTGTKRDTIGVFISRVVPDGPAEKAGIVEGERIVSINGVDLRVAAADVEDSYTAGIASHRLTREIEKVAPGSVVRLQVNSGGRTREVQVTTVRASDIRKMNGFGMVFPMEGMPMMPAMPNMKIMRDNLEHMKMMMPQGEMLPRTLSPTRIRVTTPKAPMRINLDDDISFDEPVMPAMPSMPAMPAMPAMAPMASRIPVPAMPARPRVSGQFSWSI